uniref:Peptidase_M13_N domain-containing protein n=1 Tax=Steinernema glaseri TaxID=37863 RepID=A0A1I8AAC2_9BILA
MNSIRRPAILGEEDTIPDSSTDYAELIGADKITDTVAFLERLAAASTNLYTLQQREAQETTENILLRRLRGGYYNLMDVEIRQKPGNFDKFITVLLNLQTAYKTVFMAKGGSEEDAEERLSSLYPAEDNLTKLNSEGKLGAVLAYNEHARIIYELLSKPDPPFGPRPEDLTAKLMELEDSLDLHALENSIAIREHNNACVVEKHYLVDREFYDPLFAVYPNLTKNVFYWLKYGYDIVKPSTRKPLELTDISDVLSNAYMGLLIWDQFNDSPFHFPVTLATDRSAIVRLGEEYSYMVFVNAALTIVKKYCIITDELTNQLKHLFFETVSAVGRRQMPTTAEKLASIACTFLQNHRVGVTGTALKSDMYKMSYNSECSPLRDSREALNAFCVAIIKKAAEIPEETIEGINMIKGEAAQMMTKFIMLVDCNQRAMANRYMPMIRQMHECMTPVDYY